MPRWTSDGAERLQSAAFELFEEQGFGGATVAGIALRAGLTRRTFFNHFADKREVLFTLAAAYQAEVLQSIAAAPRLRSPIESVVCALQDAADSMFEGRRDAVLRRRGIIDANPELMERELSKLAALTEAVEAALQARGTSPETASLTASVAILIQQTAFQNWTQLHETRTLRELLSEALRSLQAIVGE